MKSDPSLLLLASLGAAMLTAGGAFLRAAFTAGPSRNGSPDPRDTDPNLASLNTEAELVSLRYELSQANATKETQRIEMVEQRQRSERQVQGAQTEIERLSKEVDAEKNRTKTAMDHARELKAKLGAIEEELKRARASTPPSDPRAAAASKAGVAELEAKLKAANDDREAARSKAEALERLVEGVRARSRELAEELKVLRESMATKDTKG